MGSIECSVLYGPNPEAALIKTKLLANNPILKAIGVSKQRSRLTTLVCQRDNGLSVEESSEPEQLS